MATWKGVGELVQHLSGAEKRLFGQHLDRQRQGGEPAKYARLFALFCEAPAADEDFLKQTLAAEGHETRFFAADKRYLYIELLAFLRQQAEAKLPSVECHAMMAEARLLFLRGLTAQAEKRLRQAQKKAEASEAWLALEEGLELEQRLAGSDEEAWVRIAAQREQLRLLRQEAQDCDTALRQILALLRESPRLRSGEAHERGLQLLASPLLSQPERLRSVRARITWHRIQAAWSFMNHDPDAELRNATEAIRLLMFGNGFDQERPDLAIQLFSRVLSLCKYAPEQDFIALLNSYLALPQRLHIRNADQEAYLLGQALPITLSRYVALNDYTRAEALRRQSADGLALHGSRMQAGSRMAIHYGLASLAFAEGNTQAALKSVNQILNEFTDADRPDLYHFAQIFSLILHLDLGNLSLLEYRVQSVRQAFKKRKQLFATEKALMSFFQRCTKVRDLSEIGGLMRDLEEQLSSLLSDPYERNAHNLFDFFRWLRSRQSGRPYLHVPPGPMWERFQVKPIAGMEQLPLPMQT
jgi:hypothetical protein